MSDKLRSWCETKADYHDRVRLEGKYGLIKTHLMYHLHLGDIDTPLKLLKWIDMVGGREWADGDLIHEVVRKAIDHFKWNERSKQDDGFPDDWDDWCDDK